MCLCVCVCRVLCVFLPPIDERAVAPAAHWQEKGVKMLGASDNCMCMSLEMIIRCLMFLFQHTSQPKDVDPPYVIGMQYAIYQICNKVDRSGS